MHKVLTVAHWDHFDKTALVRLNVQKLANLRAY